jgi:hypothetical protein
MAGVGDQVAGDGLLYIGRVHYVSGGAPGAGPPGQAGPCDCSSWLNKVLAVDLGRPIPGHAAGAWRGQDHGPVVFEYATWAGAVTLPRGQRPAPGDLCVFNGVGSSAHIGIAVSPDQMVSNLNPELGVRVTGIEGNGPAGAPLTFRRLTGAAGAGAAAGGGTSSAGTAARTAAAVLLGLAVPALGVVVILGAAAVLGLAGAVVFTMGATRLASRE